MKKVEDVNFIYSSKSTKDRAFKIIDITYVVNEKYTKNYRPDFYSIFVITEGKGVMDIDFHEHSFEKGDIIFLSAGRVLKYTNLEGVKGYYILFTEDFLLEIIKDRSQMIQKVFLQTYFYPVLSAMQPGDSTLPRQVELMFDIYNEQESRFSYGILALSFITFVEMMKKRFECLEDLDKVNNPTFLKFSSLVEKNIQKTKTVEAYAEMMNVSEKTVNMATRNSLDISAKQYIIEKVIERIKLLLCFEDKTIDNIAFEMGFSAPYNLTKFFKKYTGQTPTNYRKINSVIIQE